MDGIADVRWLSLVVSCALGGCAFAADNGAYLLADPAARVLGVEVDGRPATVRPVPIEPGWVSIRWSGGAEARVRVEPGDLVEVAGSSTRTMSAETVRPDVLVASGDPEAVAALADALAADLTPTDSGHALLAPDVFARVAALATDPPGIVALGPMSIATVLAGEGGGAYASEGTLAGLDDALAASAPHSVPAIVATDVVAFEAEGLLERASFAQALRVPAGLARGAVRGGDYALRFVETRSHGCSRGGSTSTHDASLTLELEPGGVARATSSASERVTAIRAYRAEGSPIRTLSDSYGIDSRACRRGRWRTVRGAVEIALVNDPECALEAEPAPPIVLRCVAVSGRDAESGLDLPGQGLACEAADGTDLAALREPASGLVLLGAGAGWLVRADFWRSSIRSAWITTREPVEHDPLLGAE
jgi:hypothetical protein